MAQGLLVSPSVNVTRRVRMRASGDPFVRYIVRYRIGGKYAQPIHAGSFKTLPEAEEERQGLAAALGLVQVLDVVEEHESLPRATAPSPVTIPEGLPHKHVVYFVEGAGLVKIGIAFNLADRMRGLQAECPIPLTVLTAIPGRGLLERYLHGEFGEYRRHGEWFALPDDWRSRLRLVLAEWEAA